MDPSLQSLMIAQMINQGYFPELSNYYRNDGIFSVPVGHDQDMLAAQQRRVEKEYEEDTPRWDEEEEAAVKRRWGRVRYQEFQKHRRRVARARKRKSKKTRSRVRFSESSTEADQTSQIARDNFLRLRKQYETSAGRNETDMDDSEPMMYSNEFFYKQMQDYFNRQHAPFGDQFQQQGSACCAPTNNWVFPQGAGHFMLDNPQAQAYFNSCLATGKIVPTSGGNWNGMDAVFAHGDRQTTVFAATDPLRQDCRLVTPGTHGCCQCHPSLHAYHRHVGTCKQCSATWMAGPDQSEATSWSLDTNGHNCDVLQRRSEAKQNRQLMCINDSLQTCLKFFLQQNNRSLKGSTSKRCCMSSCRDRGGEWRCSTRRRHSSSRNIIRVSSCQRRSSCHSWDCTRRDSDSYSSFSSSEEQDDSVERDYLPLTESSGSFSALGKQFSGGRRRAKATPTFGARDNSLNRTRRESSPAEESDVHFTLLMEKSKALNLRSSKRAKKERIDTGIKMWSSYVRKPEHKSCCKSACARHCQRSQHKLYKECNPLHSRRTSIRPERQQTTSGTKRQGLKLKEENSQVEDKLLSACSDGKDPPANKAGDSDRALRACTKHLAGAPKLNKTTRCTSTAPAHDTLLREEAQQRSPLRPLSHGSRIGRLTSDDTDEAVRPVGSSAPKPSSGRLAVCREATDSRPQNRTRFAVLARPSLQFGSGRFKGKKTGLRSRVSGYRGVAGVYRSGSMGRWKSREPKLASRQAAPRSGSPHPSVLVHRARL